MKPFQHFISALIAMMLIIRPAFAEGLMMYSELNNHKIVIEQVFDDNVMKHRPNYRFIGESAFSTNSDTMNHATMACCDTGCYSCNTQPMESCIDSYCSIISASSGINDNTLIQISIIETSQTIAFIRSQIALRITPPEKQPPRI